MKAVNRIALGILCASIAVSAWAADFVVEIVVSPNVLVTHCKTPASVTVHADIPFATVTPGSVGLRINGTLINASAVFADDRGDLVAKFDSRAVKAVVHPPREELVLVGQSHEGTFEGFDLMPVR